MAPSTSSVTKPMKKQSSAGKASSSSLPILNRNEFNRKVNDLAYEYYLSRKGSNGSSLDDWLKAEQKILEKYHVAQ